MRSVAVAAFVLSLAIGASAAPLLRVDAPRARTGALPSERALVLDAAVLADLRTRKSALLDDFPLGVDGTVTLDVFRIEVFAPHARVDVVGAAGVEQVPLPDEVYFSGHVRGDDASRVLLVAGEDEVHGFVVHGGMTYPFGRDATGRQRVYATRDIDPATHPGPSEFCGNDLHPERGGLSAVVPRGLTPAPLVTANTSTVLQIHVAVDTDTELRAKFGSNAATLSYLASLLAASNVIYERDVSVRLLFSYVRLWSSADPWTATATDQALDEVQSYWLDPSHDMNAIAGEHDIVHFISGKSVEGGIAYVGTVCNPTYGFGVSQVFGSFDVSDPSGIWDVLVVTHEIGHNLGTPHTHCYNPPLDHCYNQEPGCYSGPVSVPPGGGTIMSYCHLLSPGLPNVNLVFGPTVSNQIRSTVEAASCLTPATSCGDGVLDPNEQCDDGNNVSGDGCSAACELETTCGDGVIGAGEQCDDGNTTSGDGCSATCQLETVCGNGIVEGVEQCDDGNTVSGDGCSSICTYETVCGDGKKEGNEQCDDGNKVAGDGCSPSCHLEVCGNHIVDPGEQCDDGNTVSGDGCSATCQHEPRCGDGVLDPGEECDDGNTTNDDGCSKSCHLEPCQIVIPHQKTWDPVKMVAANGRLSLHARFGIPTAAASLADIAASGLRLTVDGASGVRSVDVKVPGGSGWTVAGSRLRYRNRGGSAGGVRSIAIRARDEGVTMLDVKLDESGGEMPSADDLPPLVTMVLGGANAGASGACGHYNFTGGTCAKRGKRLVCR
jgi:cysteine-rich repeat protein